jgi:cytochrome c biogenesis protein CcdA
MSRKIEFGAGVAAGVLALLSFIVLLAVPFSVCTITLKTTTATCPPKDVRTGPLFQLADASTWIYLIVMLLLLLVGAGGAVAETRYGMRRGAIALWAGGVLAFMGCAFLAGPAGLFFLPALLALAIAGYSSIFQRRLARLAPPSPVVESNAQPGQSGNRS